METFEKVLYDIKEIQEKGSKMLMKKYDGKSCRYQSCVKISPQETIYIWGRETEKYQKFIEVFITCEMSPNLNTFRTLSNVGLGIFKEFSYFLKFPSPTHISFLEGNLNILKTDSYDIFCHNHSFFVDIFKHFTNGTFPLYSMELKLWLQLVPNLSKINPS